MKSKLHFNGYYLHGKTVYQGIINKTFLLNVCTQ